LGCHQIILENYSKPPIKPLKSNTVRFNVHKFYVLPTQCVYVFCVDELLSSTNMFRVLKPRRMRWAGHVACMGGRTGTYRVWVEGPEGSWEDDIKNDLQEVEWGETDWTDMAEDTKSGGLL
jgi:hypothetical protein